MATKFRSKLEKECAEALGKEWKYEPCRIAYTIRKNYTPDFVKGKYHIEVKGFFRSGNHYKQGNIEVIDFILDQDMDYLTASVMKYICRWRYKNGLEDLKKAQWFLKKLIEHEGGQYGSNIK